MLQCEFARGRRAWARALVIGCFGLAALALRAQPAGAAGNVQVPRAGPPVGEPIHSLIEQNCQVCHNSDGSGKMGPPLIGGNFIYPQTADDVGMFAIIYAGASGAMQSFANRGMAQDDMLKIIAFVRSLDK